MSSDSLTRNKAGQSIAFGLISALTGAADTAATVSVFITIDNASQISGVGAVTNKGNGQYVYAPTQSETNGVDAGFLFTSPGDLPVNIDFHTDGQSGPGVTTTLTNKPAGPPGKHFTKKQKDNLLFGIYQEGLLAKEALKRFDGMGELERAEAELKEAQSYYAEAADRQSTSYSRSDYDDAEDAASRLSAAKDKVGDLRTKAAKRKAIDDAKQKIKDAIAKRKGR